MNRPAFTLVELLTVIGIIGVLTALMLPAIQYSRAVARQKQCQNHLRQIGLGILNYWEIKDTLPPGRYNYKYSEPTEKSPEQEKIIRHNLIAYLLPYIEQTALADLYHFDVNFQNDINDPATKNHLQLLYCPDYDTRRWCRFGSGTSTAHQKIIAYFCSDYAPCPKVAVTATAYKTFTNKVLTNVHPDLTGVLIFQNDPNNEKTNTKEQRAEPCGLASIADGTSNSIMLVECVARPFNWTSEEGKIVRGSPEEAGAKEPIGGADWSDDESAIKCNVFRADGQMLNVNNHREMFSFHSGGSNFLYGDGHVAFHPVSITPDVLISALTAQAGD